MGKINNEMRNIGALLVSLAALLAGVYSFLGFTGVMTMAGIFIFWFVPSYLILLNFEISMEEKVILSFFLAIIVISSLVYWSSFAISFRISIYIAAGLLILAGILLRIRGGGLVRSGAVNDNPEQNHDDGQNKR